ncbi:MAG: hypothetical protein A4E57_00646 [Syntrophorhabdaceae bacterium PtaU1.Bin034]|jgi:hypothetical protein|nr:MAG: hypothetical protein A4E57_00646 [Syntrophorhabdaceae bacterium PtaU1.Bin034]
MKMKKLLGMMAGAALLLGMATQSMAAFEDLKLIRTLYDRSASVTAEIGTDLGVDLTTVSGASGDVGSLVALSSFTGLSSLSSFVVSYYGFNDAVLNEADYWITGTADVAPVLLARKGVTLQGIGMQLQDYYAQTGGIADKSHAKAYESAFDVNGTAFGTFGNTLAAGSLVANIYLADLATGDHYVDSYLYFFDYNNRQSGSTTGVQVAQIRTYMTAGADGNYDTLFDNFIGTTINPSAVPVPASLLLFAPGLLGLIGLRRRNAK